MRDIAGAAVIESGAINVGNVSQDRCLIGDSLWLDPASSGLPGQVLKAAPGKIRAQGPSQTPRALRAHRCVAASLRTIATYLGTVGEASLFHQASANTPFEPSTQTLHAIDVPTMVVRGGSGHRAMRRIVELLREAIPGPQLVRIDVRSHLLPSSHSEEIARLVRRHVEGSAAT
jgi:pimeloyl-ACP methyl ester carboxylesterase